jgi:hypothetical protein
MRIALWERVRVTGESAEKLINVVISVSENNAPERKDWAGLRPIPTGVTLPKQENGSHGVPFISVCRACANNSTTYDTFSYPSIAHHFRRIGQGTGSPSLAAHLVIC